MKSHRSKIKRSTPSLRPPTLMIDLLFGALMLFAFEMGNPNVQEVFSHKIDLPDEDRSGSQKSEEVLPLVPVRLNDTTWIYETGDRKKLTADQVAQQVKKTKSTYIYIYIYMYSLLVRP